MRTVHAVMCGDRNVIHGMAVSGRSALEHSSGPLAITVLGSGLTPADKSALERSWKHDKLASVEIFDLDYEVLKHFRSTKYLKSKVTYARYFIEDFLPDVDRVVYLDSDLIVMRDLHEIAFIDLDGAIAGAVLDISTRANGGQVELCNRLGIDPDGYFNSGFMVIDLAAWKEQKIKDKLIKLSIDLFDELDAQDQSALNVVLAGKTKVLDVAWNTIQYEAEPSFSDGILHLIGSVKPWHPDYAHHFSGRFFEYLDRTAFAGWRPSSRRSLRALLIQLSRKVPTADMLVGKVRRLARAATS